MEGADMTVRTQNARPWLLGVGACVLASALVALTLFAGQRDGPSRDDMVALGDRIGVLAKRLDAMASTLEAMASQVDRMRSEVQRLSERVRALREKGSAAAPSRRAAARIAPGVKFRDTFEQGTDGWFIVRFAPEIIGKIARTTQKDRF
jgi:hypothetical protein